ncbi:MAG: site-specific DNA-methyltransferase [Tepidanaerobacteraceae bacterium]|jgi:adenine-specific DNA-methyltransferase|nr:site-specific DNA-methyltransferase [Tepidanaerobacteraceae bacterium]
MVKSYIDEDIRYIEQYEHKGKTRLNNPPVGLVTPQTERESGKKKYQYDPHIDPSLQWAGKAEHMSFEVPTVSLHVHERIDPRKIIDQFRNYQWPKHEQLSLFETKEEYLPMREAVEFYKHRHNWTNRLIAGDSLLVMNSLLEKEGMAGQVQTIYIDPPYGIKYGSNFQPFVNKRDVKDGKDEDLTQEPEMIKAFRDTWELGIHSYLTYLRDRLLLAKELLHESGSIFVQISDENVHLVRCLMDEVFGKENFISQISFRKKTMPLGAKYMEQMHDFILFYAKNKQVIKYRDLYINYSVEGSQDWKWVELPDGTRREMTKEERNNFSLLPKGSRIYRLKHPSPIGENEKNKYDFYFQGKKYSPPQNGWGMELEKLERLAKANRIQVKGNMLNYILYFDDFPVTKLTSPWNDTVGPQDKTYVVQTSELPIQRCILMTTDPGDLVFDPTCGSGTTAYVAEQWGRRWITCDTSRVAIALAKQRLMTAVFDYYELARPEEGVGSGFRYKTVPHITLKSIANNEPPAEETLYDQPYIDRKKIRVTGPFTVEAVPAPTVKSLDDVGEDEGASDISVVRSGETLRQAEWRQELLRTGIRAKNGQRIEFSRVEPFQGSRWIQAEGETKEDVPKRVLISFGPEYAPLEQKQVEQAWQEARMFRPDILLFCAFQFDEEAAKDIDELKPEIAGMQLLKVQMNADLFTEDLKKKRSGNDSFWLIGQPDVKVKRIAKGEDKGKYQVEVLGFDYYNTKTGNVESGGKNNIAMWMLDTNYDGRSLFPTQVFFPMAGAGGGWAKLARTLRAEIDEERMEAFRGTTSLPFEVGPNKTIAVKIIDDRGIESLRVIRL